MWRYREMLPLLPATRRSRSVKASRRCCTRGVSAPPSASTACSSRTSRSIPTNSFKARGQSAAITRAKALGADTIALPTAGNAGNAAAAYAAAAGLRCEVFIPKDAKQPFVDECRLYGAHVTLVDGLITDAGRMAAEKGKPLGWYERLDAEGAVPRRGQEDHGLRARRAARLGAARLDHLSHRRRHRPRRHVEGVRGDGSASAGSAPKRPKMVSVQAEGCAPIVRAFETGAETAAPWENATTVADGLRVPRAIGDFLILRAIRESGGTALAVSDRADGRGHAGHRPPRGHLGRARGRRRAHGHPRARRRRAGCTGTRRWCCSIPAAR